MCLSTALSTRYLPLKKVRQNMSLFAGLKTVKKTTQPEITTAPTDRPVNSEKKAEARAGEGIATVGDGGAGWKLKALKRAQVKAKDSGQSLDQVQLQSAVD